MLRTTILLSSICCICFNNLFCQQINSFDSSGYRQGLWIEFWENGNKKNEREYQDGKMYGEYRTYRENGMLYGSGFMENDRLNGEFVSYDSTGMVLSIMLWRNGELIETTILNSKAKETGTVEEIRGKKYVWLFGELKEVKSIQE